MVLIAQGIAFAASEGAWRPTHAAEALRGMFDPSRREAAERFVRSEGAKAVQPLLAAMTDERRRRAGLALIAKLGDKAVPALLELGDDPELAVRAGSVLAQVTGPASAHRAAELLACVRSKPRINHYCGQALVLAMSPKAGKQAPVLIEALSDPDVDARVYAATALGRLGRKAKAAIPALEKLAAGDAEEAVRRQAREALRKING